MKKGLPVAFAAGLLLLSFKTAAAGDGQNAGAKPAEILFTVQLILGSVSDEDRTDESLKNDPVIKEIRSLMKYRTFLLLDSSLVRSKEREPVEAILGKQRQYILFLKPTFDKDENIRTEIRFSYNFPGQKGTDLIQSILALKPGERTVLGVSKPQGIEPVDQGLILIISGKFVRRPASP
jgi:hypothetical protein